MVVIKQKVETVSNLKLADDNTMEKIYRSLNSMTKHIFVTIDRWSFMSQTYIDAIVKIDIFTKTNGTWHTRDFRSQVVLILWVS